MKVKIGRKILITICSILVVTIIISIPALYTKQATPAEKFVVKGYASWRGYTFETAIEEATTIVYGKVIDKSGTKVREYTNPDGREAKEYYVESTIEVIDLIKGDSSLQKVKYIEMGGETATHIYETDGIEPINIGEERVFFLNENGVFLSPMTLVPVENGTVLLNGAVKPDDIATKLDANSNASVSDYLDLIKAIVQ